MFFEKYFSCSISGAFYSFTFTQLFLAVRYLSLSCVFISSISVFECTLLVSIGCTFRPVLFSLSSEHMLIWTRAAESRTSCSLKCVVWSAMQCCSATLSFHTGTRSSGRHQTRDYQSWGIWQLPFIVQFRHKYLNEENEYARALSLWFVSTSTCCNP